MEEGPWGEKGSALEEGKWGWFFSAMFFPMLRRPGERWGDRQGHFRPKKKLRPGCKSRHQQETDGTRNIGGPPRMY